MMALVRLLLLPACIVAALCCARYFPKFTLGLGLFLPVFGGLLLAIIAVSATADDLREVHRWTSHYYVIYLWLAVPIAAAVLLYRKVFDRPVRAFFQCAVLGSLIAIAIVNGITGYLPAQNDLPRETYLRFLILHGFFLPGMLLCGHGLWLWFAWPERLFRGADQPNG